MHTTDLGTGPEVVEQAVRVLELVSAASPHFELKLESHDFGGCAIDSTGEPLPPSTLKACEEADAILMGESFCTSTKVAMSTPRRLDWWPQVGRQRKSTP